MAPPRVPFMLIPPALAIKLGARFKGIGARAGAVAPNLAYDLKNANMEMTAESYAVGSLFSSLIWGVFACIFLILITKVRAMTGPVTVVLPLMGMLVVTMVFFMLHLYFLRTIVAGLASQIDRGLLFAARDMLIQVSSGIPLFTVMANIADGDYGMVSVEFKKTVGETRSGTGLTIALENMAVRNQSKYLKKMCWQLITAMRSGSNLTTALKGIIKLLVDYQMRLNKAYNAELNFIVLIYLMCAAVLPTVGTTVLVIFSVFGVLGVTPEIYAGLVGFAFLVQIMVIGYVYMKRPKMYE